MKFVVNYFSTLKIKGPRSKSSKWFKYKIKIWKKSGTIINSNIFYSSKENFSKPRCINQCVSTKSNLLHFPKFQNIINILKTWQQFVTFCTSGLWSNNNIEGRYANLSSLSIEHKNVEWVWVCYVIKHKQNKQINDIVDK